MTIITKQTMKELAKKNVDFIKTILFALIIAGLIRSFIFEPFHIPSGSMKPNLLIGDYIIVNKSSYGYSRYSFPFGFKFFEGRIFASKPQRGDVAVFRLPSNPKINYVKRIIGLPGDKVQMIDGRLYINDQEVSKKESGNFYDEGSSAGEIKKFTETLPISDDVKKEIVVLDQADLPQDNTGIYHIPEASYFMMGDNRDNSQDSRFLNDVGYVPEENLIGRASFIFMSSEDSLWKIWKAPVMIRFHRIFSKVN